MHGTEGLAQVAFDHLEAFEASLPDRLRSLWRDLIERRRAVRDRADEYLLAAGTQPIVAVPTWADEAIGGIGAASLEAAVGASVIGYHALRLQDDLADEGIGEPVPTLLLSAAAISRAEGLLARFVADDRFWRAHEAAMAGFGEAMLAERELAERPTSYDEAAFDLVLRRSAPLASPGLAILAAGGRWDAADDFTEAVRLAGKAVQIAHDLVDARRDLDAGRYTWVLVQLGAHEGEAGLADRFSTGFDAVVDTALGCLARAVDLAERVGSTSMAGWAGALEAEVERRRTQFWMSVFDPSGGPAV